MFTVYCIEIHGIYVTKRNFSRNMQLWCISVSEDVLKMYFIFTDPRIVV
jgi:hypothetical protein